MSSNASKTRQAVLAHELRKLGCSNAKQHVKGEPVGYMAWHAWAEQKSQKFDQEQCPGCGLWVIWRSKKTGRVA